MIFRVEKKKVLGKLFTLMDKDTKGIGEIIWWMEKEHGFSQMEYKRRELGKEEKENVG